ncbi:PREDICTED: transcription factor Sp9-like [Rhagoletis zephyria]|uniref:transcription factor Sp9-like n=1 Tax=Rhagoletis zephyria TaxID=28612 RepID=UPI0008113571|nr:PREDICTED: transcription factor Sp9-like [Rhagoletis zephyria]
MVGQVKEMLLPPKTGNDQVKTNAASTPTPVKPPTTKSPMNTSTVSPSHPPKSKMIFAAKSKPGPFSSAAASQPFSGLYKRMAEEDEVGVTSNSNSQPNKKKAVTVELQIDGPLGDEDDYGDVAIDDSAGGGNIELANISANPINNVSNVSEKHRRQPTQSGKHPCTEPNCGKHFLSNAELKRHMRTHTKAKPFGCTFPGCSKEFSQRENAIRHILTVHLKKQKPNNAEGGGNEVADDPSDPSTYLTVKEELL